MALTLIPLPSGAPKTLYSADEGFITFFVTGALVATTDELEIPGPAAYAIRRIAGGVSAGTLQVNLQQVTGPSTGAGELDHATATAADFDERPNKAVVTTNAGDKLFARFTGSIGETVNCLIVLSQSTQNAV